jgi:hypothetical protein
MTDAQPRTLDGGPVLPPPTHDLEQVKADLARCGLGIVGRLWHGTGRNVSDRPIGERS